MLFRKVYSLHDKLAYFFAGGEGEKNFLGFFRISVSLVAIIEIASLAVDLSLFYSARPLIPQEIMFLQTDYFKYLHPLYQFLEKHQLTESFYTWTIILYLVALFFMLFGLFTRFAAVLALLLQIIIYKSFSNFNYGYDNFITMSLFYCLVFPVGKFYSLDAKIFKWRPTIYFSYRRVLQVHLAIAYFFSGIAKSLDTGWWNGEAIWRALASVDNELYSLPPLLLATLTVGTVSLELLYPFGIIKKSTRKYFVGAMILMHIGIAILMKLYAFSAIMIVWNVAAFGNLMVKKASVNESIAV